MSNRIPNILQRLLFEYENKLKIHFGDKVYGVYLYNSIALGAFDINKSDIDFITIITEELTNEEIINLRSIHSELSNEFPYAKRMEGMYITIDNISKVNLELKPYVYFAENKLKDHGYYDLNYVTWYTLKNNGISVNSPAVNTLNIKVEWDNIVQTMNYNLNQYWKSKLNKSFIFLTDFWVEFSVLTLCRILYTLEHKTINSKVASAQYVLGNLKEKHRLVVNEALRIRENTSDKSLFTSRIKRFKEVREFIGYTIEYCNERYKLVVEESNNK